MSSTPTQVYPSVDWLTATVAGDSASDEAYAKARALAVEQHAAGDRIKPWGANGFRGFGTPHLRCGVRGPEVLVELSGALAERHWRSFYALATNVSRLDTCVTVTFPRETRNLAIDGFKAPRVAPRPGFPAIRKTIWEQVDAGQTLYLGSPKSSRFGRLYDKTAESRGEWPEWSWRWELQERRALGSARAGLIDGSDNVHRAIAASVHGFFAYHGVTPWFHADGPTVFSTARRPRPDVQRYSAYLGRCIAPGMRRWIDAGHGDAIRAALGLDDHQLLQALGLAELVAGQLRGGAGPTMKGDAACRHTPTLEDLTPPRSSPTTTPSPRALPPAIGSGRDAIAAVEPWPRAPGDLT